MEEGPGDHRGRVWRLAIQACGLRGVRAGCCRHTRRNGYDPDTPKRCDVQWLEAVLAKFTQHADLRATLLATGDSTIVEHTDKDHYSGDGGDRSGKSRLGKILMQVRDELRSKRATGDPAAGE
jgi:ribA/ribD-fused uncharacterized protein